MKYLVFIFCMMNVFCQAQSKSFVYKTQKKQNFSIHPSTEKLFHYIKIYKQDVVLNTLFNDDEKNYKLIIPEDGFYEIAATFNFNPQTSLIKHNRGGLNFGVVQISEGTEQYIAATRKSFNKDTEDVFSEINLYPTIVYLQKGVLIAPAISSGLLARVLVNSELGCDKKNKNCTTFQWSIKLISDEKSHQKYY